MRGILILAGDNIWRLYELSLGFDFDFCPYIVLRFKAVYGSKELKNVQNMINPRRHVFAIFPLPDSEANMHGLSNMRGAERDIIQHEMFKEVCSLKDRDLGRGRRLEFSSTMSGGPRLFIGVSRPKNTGAWEFDIDVMPGS